MRVGKIGSAESVYVIVEHGRKAEPLENLDTRVSHHSILTALRTMPTPFPIVQAVAYKTKPSAKMLACRHGINLVDREGFDLHPSQRRALKVLTCRNAIDVRHDQPFTARRGHQDAFGETGFRPE